VTIASGGTVLGGWFFKKSGPRPVGWMLALAFFCYGISYIGIALSPNYLVGMVFDALGQFAGGYVLPTLIVWALSKYSFESRGRGMGIWGACFFVGQFLSPPVMTLIAHGQLSFLTSVGIVGGFCIVAAVLCTMFRSAPAAVAQQD
jgi:MFS family permease